MATAWVHDLAHTSSNCWFPVFEPPTWTALVQMESNVTAGCDWNESFRGLRVSQKVNSLPISLLKKLAVKVSTFRFPECRDGCWRHKTPDSSFSFDSPSSGPRRKDRPSGVQSIRQLESKWKSVACCSVRKKWPCAFYSIRGNVIGQLQLHLKGVVFFCVETKRNRFHPSGRNVCMERVAPDRPLAFRLRSESTFSVWCS